MVVPLWYTAPIFPRFRTTLTTTRDARRRTIERAEQQLPDLLGRLRWVVPGLIAALGVSYVIIEHYLFLSSGSMDVSLAHVIREAAVVGTIGPTLGWILLTSAAHIAQSRHEAQLELGRRAMQLEIGSQVARQMTSILDIDLLLELVADSIRRSFGYDHVQIFLVDREQNVAVLREVSGPAEARIKAAGLRLRIGEQGIVAHVAQIGRPVLSNDVEQEERYLLSDLVPDTRSELALPLQVGDQILGVLDLQSNSHGAFDEQDVQALQLLGDQIAIAIENARLFQETRQRFQAMTALHQTSLDIVSQLNSRQVLEAILRRATELIRAQGASLAVYDAQADLVRVRATYNLPPEYEGVTLCPGEAVAGTVVQTGEPVIVNDYRDWERRSPIFEDSPYNAIIGVPLRWQDEVTGCLTALDRPETRRFVEEDTWLLSLFADLASIAIKNAELYGTVTDLTQTLEQRVAQRTGELAAAQSELAEKADQLSELLAATVRVQEEERTRIARDLHDGSNQLITGTLYEIQAAEQSLRNRKAATTVEKLNTAKKLLRSLEAENRRIIGGLRPPVLDDRGLIPALKAYASSIERRYGISCSVEISGQPVRLSSELEIAVYRIVQESLNNVVAHADAKNVEIHIDYKYSRLWVTIQDDGVGFDATDVLASASDKMGLIGMRERAQSIGGRIEVKSAHGQGSTIVFDVPIESRDAPLASEPRRW